MNSARNYHMLISVGLCLLACKDCYASVYCEDQNGVIQYSCDDSAYCCGHTECCALENGVDFFTLWYFWAACGLGILIIGLVSGMFCKGKRHHDRECRVHDVSLNSRSSQQQAGDMQQPQLQPQPHLQLQPQPHLQLQPQRQQPQVVVIPVMYNQPPSQRQGAFNLSGSVLPMATMATAMHPSMQQPHGRHRGPPPVRARQTDPLPGGVVKPLGPAYQQPPAYGPLPPGYVPQA